VQGSILAGLAGVWLAGVWLVWYLVDVWCWSGWSGVWSGWCLVLVVSQMPAVWLVLVWLVWCLVWLVSGAGGVPDASRLAGAGLAGVWCWWCPRCQPSGWCWSGWCLVLVWLVFFIAC